MSCHINSFLTLQAVYFMFTSPPGYPTPGRTYVTYRQDVGNHEQLCLQVLSHTSGCVETAFAFFLFNRKLVDNHNFVLITP